MGTTPTITATPGHPNANSYITLADADTWFADGMDEDRWEEFDDEWKSKALIAATRAIERLNLRGVPDDTTTPQALHFPRERDKWQAIGREEFTSDYDTAVQLDQVELREGSVEVTDSDETVYTADTDYTIDYGDGTITVLSTGDMSDATTYFIEYEYLGVPQDVRDACCLQALHIAEAKATPELIDRRALQAQGVKTIAMDGISESYGGRALELCWEAQELMGHYIRRTGRIQGRGGR